MSRSKWVALVPSRTSGFHRFVAGFFCLTLWDSAAAFGARASSLSPNSSFAIGTARTPEGPSSSSLSKSEDGDGDRPMRIRGGCCRRRCASGNSNLGGQATSGEKSGCSGGKRELAEGLYLYIGLIISCFCPRLDTLINTVRQLKILKTYKTYVSVGLSSGAILRRGGVFIRSEESS